MPAVRNFFEFEITDEPTLIEIGVPREYSGIEIERELIPVGVGGETLIERVYYRHTPATGGERELVAASSIFIPKLLYGPGLTVYSMVPWRPGISTSRGIGEDDRIPRDFLMDPLPFDAPMIVRKSDDE